MPRTAKRPAPRQKIDKHDPDAPFLGAAGDAVARWRAWATAMADGQPCPAEPRILLDVAAVLGVREPAATLAKDADTIVAIRALGERRRAAHELDERELAEVGGTKGIEKRIEKLNEEIGRLRMIAACPRAWTASSYLQQIIRMKKDCGRLFADTYTGESR